MTATSLPVTAVYAGFLALLFIYLSLRVIRARRGARVEIGHGDSAELLRRMRVHANFAEYTPLAVLLIGLAEGLKAPVLLLHFLGASFLIGRAVHAYALSQTPHILRLRVISMQITLAVIATAALTSIVLGLTQLVQTR